MREQVHKSLNKLSYNFWSKIEKVNNVHILLVKVHKTEKLVQRVLKIIFF